MRLANACAAALLEVSSPHGKIAPGRTGPHGRVSEANALSSSIRLLIKKQSLPVVRGSYYQYIRS